eukprot:428621_1
MSRKRQLQSICNTIPPTKKPKLIPIHSSSHSTLFSDPDDLKQFQSIYKELIESNMIKQLQCPASILKEISEFATGYIKKCDNYMQCGNEILVLKKHKYTHTDYTVHETDTHNPIHEYEFEHDYQIFCNDCAGKTISCSYKEIHVIEYISSHFGGDVCDEFYCRKQLIRQTCSCGNEILECVNHRQHCDSCDTPVCRNGDTEYWIYDEAYCKHHGVYECLCCDGKICKLQIDWYINGYDFDCVVCGEYCRFFVCDNCGDRKSSVELSTEIENAIKRCIDCDGKGANNMI